MAIYVTLCSLPDGDGVAQFCQNFGSIKCEEGISRFNQMASMEVAHLCFVAAIECW